MWDQVAHTRMEPLFLKFFESKNSQEGHALKIILCKIEKKSL